MTVLPPPLVENKTFDPPVESKFPALSLACRVAVTEEPEMTAEDDKVRVDCDADGGGAPIEMTKVCEVERYPLLTEI